MEMERKSRILIIGGTGHVGQWITKASISLQHPTFLLVRPASLAARPDLAPSLTSLGTTILPGSLDDKSSLVEAIKQVDIVISAVRSLPDLLQQLNIVEAIQAAGGTQRFLPSEYGVDVNGEGARVALECLQDMFDKKRIIRKAIAAAGISFTCVCSFCFVEYFAKTLGQPGGLVASPPTEKVIIYGDGQTKASFMCEEDIGMLTIKAANDPRTLNKVIHLRFPNNILSQLELIALWEQKIGKTLEKNHISEEDILEKVKEDMYWAMKHAVFIKGSTCIFKESDKDLEAYDLYPLEPYTSIDQYFTKLVDELNLMEQKAS